jgi:hypothetical protein
LASAEFIIHWSPDENNNTGPQSQPKPGTDPMEVDEVRRPDRLYFSAKKRRPHLALDFPGKIVRRIPELLSKRERFVLAGETL